MKRKKAFFCAGLLCLCLCVSMLLSGCGEDAEGDGIVGTWKIVECIVDGEPLQDMNDCWFHFYEDGTGEKYILEELQFTYSYSYDESTCVLYNLTFPDGETEAGTYAEMTIKGNTMTVNAVEDGVEEIITLRRQSSES